MRKLVRLERQRQRQREVGKGDIKDERELAAHLLSALYVRHGQFGPVYLYYAP